MKIKDSQFVKEDKYRIRTELTEFLSQPSDKKERPCPGCRLSFPDCPSIHSTNHCSYKCEEAHKQMSSDPIRYPIEPNIVSMVYCMYTLRLLMPCWSCEGHENSDNEIIKFPKVWFYSTSSFYVKLVSQAISSFRSKRIIHYPWLVKILPYSQSMFTLTYSLEPAIELDTNYQLSLLQKDIVTIADNLRFEMFKLAEKYIEESNKSPFRAKTL
ncbi:MAG: hypothetical protein MJK12_11115 [Colwellia sp.]|nr:hypothetical protein [Colwellia sp.]